MGSGHSRLHPKKDAVSERTVTRPSDDDDDLMGGVGGGSDTVVTQESGGFVVRFIPYTIRESYSAVSCFVFCWYSLRSSCVVQ